MSQTLPLIALGGAIGSVLRYLFIAALGAPWGTAGVNVLGSLTIGVLFVLLDARVGWQLLLMTGVMGGFTTFSAFSLDTFTLWERGQTLTALAYVAASILLSLAALAAGIYLARGALA